MKTITPYRNHGRWLVDCPRHGSAGAREVTENDTEYIAHCCYPKIIAMFQVSRNHRIIGIPDTSARRTARTMAQQANDIYTIVFPEKIEQPRAKKARKKEVK